MPASYIRSDPDAVAELVLDPAPRVTPMAEREENRLFRTRSWLWGKQFVLRLKSNAQWMSRFLHGRM